MADTVYILMITQRNGHTLSAHSTADKSRAALDRYVAQNWEEQLGDDAMPEDLDERLSWYFHDGSAEFYDFATLVVDED